MKIDLKKINIPFFVKSTLSKIRNNNKPSNDERAIIGLLHSHKKGLKKVVPIAMGACFNNPFKLPSKSPSEKKAPSVVLACFVNASWVVETVSNIFFDEKSVNNVSLLLII